MSYRIDLRRVRAQQAASSIFNLIITRYVPYACQQEAYDELYKRFHEAGAELITDVARQEYGLPARSPDGWTAEEIVELEKRRLEALSKPLTMKVEDASS